MSRVQPAGHTIGISGTRLTLDGEPFPLTGLSFFNALFNPAFNRDAGERRRWLEHFLSYGINMLRVWCQWDFSEPRLFADVAPDQSMYTSSGDLQHTRCCNAAVRWGEQFRRDLSARLHLPAGNQHLAACEQCRRVQPTRRLHAASARKAVLEHTNHEGLRGILSRCIGRMNLDGV